ncbi:hypothetical protein PMAYCL1PPCAC_08334, partial [Pristionchus mayeri]
VGPCILSPKVLIGRQRFFENLIDLLPHQQELVDWFLCDRTTRASVCTKHFRKIQEKNIEAVHEREGPSKSEAIDVTKRKCYLCNNYTSVFHTIPDWGEARLE